MSRRIKHIILLLSIVFSMIGQHVRAQQDPIYSQYMNNLLSINPAYAGVRGCASFSGIFREQWLGIEGQPSTTSLTFHFPLDTMHVGLGTDIVNDKIGPLQTTGFFLDYAYRLKATHNSTLSLGVKGGFNYVEAKLTELYRYHYDDMYILEHGDFSQAMINFGIGAFWYSDNFYVGLAVPRLLTNNFTSKDYLVNYASREERHYFLHGAYIHPIHPDVTFKPAIYLTMVKGAPFTADFDLAFLLKEKVWVGMMLRISDAIGGYVQYHITDQVKVGLAYDYTHTRLKNYNSGTFEFLLRYDFNFKVKNNFPGKAF